MQTTNWKIRIMGSLLIFFLWTANAYAQVIDDYDLLDTVVVGKKVFDENNNEPLDLQIRKVPDSVIKELQDGKNSGTQMSPGTNRKLLKGEENRRS